MILELLDRFRLRQVGRRVVRQNGRGLVHFGLLRVLFVVLRIVIGVFVSILIFTVTLRAVLHLIPIVTGSALAVHVWHFVRVLRLLAGLAAQRGCGERLLLDDL